MSENVIVDKVSGQIQTTDTNTTTILSYDLIENFSGECLFVFVGKDVNNGNTVVGRASFAIKRGTGDASMVGSVVYSLPIQSDLSMITASASVRTSGASVLISVSGVLLTTIDWWTQLSVSGIYQ